MKQTQKYLAAAALAFSSIFAAASVDATEPPQIKSFELRIHWGGIVGSKKQFDAHITEMAVHHYKAIESNNSAMLRYSEPAAQEIIRRGTKCEALYEQANRDIHEEAKNSPHLGSKMSESFKQLYHQIASQCDIATFPNIVVTDDGTILADSILDRPTIRRWGDMVWQDTNRRAYDSITRFKRSINTSSVLALRRLESRMDQLLDIQEQCTKSRDKFLKVLNNSDDLIQIRLHKNSMIRICTREPKL